MKRTVSFVMAVLLLFSALPFGAAAVDLQIEGKSAVLMDSATGTVLYEKDAHTALPPASVTKVMTLLLVMEAVDSGKIKMTDTVTASETAAEKGGSQIYLKVGETMSVEDMVKSIAVSSANDCACAMAEHIAGSEAGFVELMNKRAKELGMENTHFVNCTGLDDDQAAKDHLISAYDIALMSRELLVNHPDIKKYTTIWMDTVRDGTFGLSNTNKMVRFYKGCTGLKTGFTSGAGYCLSSAAERDGTELIAVVMGAETSAKRFSACKSMLDYGFANYCVYRPEVTDGSVAVKMGKEEAVMAVPSQNTPVLLEKSLRDSVTTELTLEPFVTAPVSKGQRLGTATVKAGDKILAQIPLVSQVSVSRLTFWDIFKTLLHQAAG
ncbi:MAG: D-alanyl-D-alanine carboxypeptidase [Oscillospiraceae bacterium]|nr:D-alanyl-D-alanine carboxypeptidase [Oscillospiraceae bacterium]